LGFFKAYLASKWIRDTYYKLDYGLRHIHQSFYLINGEPTNLFNSNRGLTKCFPMSPLLFILMMEGLSLALNKEKDEGLITGIKVSRMINILHLLFVNDILIMSRATLSDWMVTQDIFQNFCKAS